MNFTKVIIEGKEYVKLSHVIARNKETKLSKKLLKEKLRPTATKLQGFGRMLFVKLETIKPFFNIKETATVNMEIDENVKEEMDKTLAIKEELELREGAEDDIEALLVNRYLNKEFNLTTLNNIVYQYKLHFPMFLYDKQLQEYLEKNDYTSLYNKYIEATEQEYYGTRVNITLDQLKEFQSDSSDLYLKNNHAEEQEYTVIHDDGNYGELIYIFKGQECIAQYCYSDDEIYQHVEKLSEKYGYCDYYIKEALDDLINKLDGYKLKMAEKRKRQAQYDKDLKWARETFNKYHYYVPQFAFEDIWNSITGIIWNTNKYNQFIKEGRKKMEEFTNNFHYSTEELLGYKPVDAEDKPSYKKMYLCLAKNFHPDIVKDDGKMMQLVNNLKHSWGL